MTTETDDTRQRIIEAALQLFGEIGYTRATTRAIAQTAGVNEVTVFRHFGSKKNLLVACIQAGNQRGFAQLFEEHLSGDYVADIRMMARLQMALTRQNFDLLRLLLCDAQTLPELKEVLAGGAADNHARLTEYFRKQIESGAVQPDLDPAILAHAFDSLFSSYTLFERFISSPVNVPDDTRIETLTKLFLQGTQFNQ